MIDSKHYNQLRQIIFLSDFNTEDATTPLVDKVSLKGRFHGWGTHADERHNNQTVAIVEDQTGNIHSINPVDMKFVDTEYHLIADE